MTSLGVVSIAMKHLLAVISSSDTQQDYIEYCLWISMFSVSEGKDSRHAGKISSLVC